MRVAGIDIGSRFIKLVVLDNGEIKSTRREETGHAPLETCRSMLAASGAQRCVATGYGRYLMEVFSDICTITEIKAVALGAKTAHPDCRAVIDIGGQDTKVIALDDAGKVMDFEMNDRCAAGTGRFLEIMARTLGYSLEEFGTVGTGSTADISINSMCTVFAESEVVSLIAKGLARDQIASAVHGSVANRVAALAKRHAIRDDIVFAGGCARNSCLRTALEQRLGRSMVVHGLHDLLAAYGAALHALEFNSVKNAQLARV